MNKGIRLIGRALRFLFVDLAFAAIREAMTVALGNSILWVRRRGRCCGWGWCSCRALRCLACAPVGALENVRRPVESARDEIQVQAQGVIGRMGKGWWCPGIRANLGRSRYNRGYSWSQSPNQIAVVIGRRGDSTRRAIPNYSPWSSGIPAFPAPGRDSDKWIDDGQSVVDNLPVLHIF